MKITSKNALYYVAGLEKFRLYLLEVLKKIQNYIAQLKDKELTKAEEVMCLPFFYAVEDLEEDTSKQYSIYSLRWLRNPEKELQKKYGKYVEYFYHYKNDDYEKMSDVLGEILSEKPSRKINKEDII